MQGNMTAGGSTAMQKTIAVGFTVMQEIKTLLSQAACLRLIRQIQKKYYYESDEQSSSYWYLKWENKNYFCRVNCNLNIHSYIHSFTCSPP